MDIKKLKVKSRKFVAQNKTWPKAQNTEPRTLITIFSFLQISS